MTQRHDITFESQGVTCRAWHYTPVDDAFTSAAGCACVVLAHGFGGTRDAGLEPYAQAFANAGLHALVFDYRHFGASDGQPRQLLSVSRQLNDWAEAIECARGLDGVDPARIALWGSSFSGGHVIVAAARDGRVAAVSSQGPMMDGLAAVLNIIGYAGVGQVLRLTAAGLHDLGRAVLGRQPRYIPLIAEPGGFAAMSSNDSLSGYGRITPADWRNEFTARTALALGLYRPIKSIRKLPCPTLILACNADSVAPAKSALKAARLAGPRAEVREYPMGHFDIYVDDGFQRSSTDQIAFFRKHLAK